MEFAEWVVSGLEQLRTGRLPGGDPLYQAVASGLGDSTALNAYMNSGDDAARAALVQAIAQAVAANPGLEQQVRQAAEAVQNAQNTQVAQGVQPVPGYGPPAKPPFLKTTNGVVVLIAAAVVVVGGGVGLAVGLGGDGGSLASTMKGTWTCTVPDQESKQTFTVGDGTWSAGDAHGTWKQDGGKATLSDPEDSGNNIVATGMPSGPGAFDITVAPADAVEGDTSRVLHLKGNVSSHKLTVAGKASGSEFSFSVLCTK